MATLDLNFIPKGFTSGQRQTDGLTASVARLENLVNKMDLGSFSKKIESLGTIFKNATKDVNAFATAISNASKSTNKAGMDALKASVQSYKIELQRLKNENQQLRNDLISNNKAIADAKLAYEEGRNSQQSYRTEVARLRAEIESLRLKQVQNRQQITATNGSYREAQQRLTALGNTIKNAENGFIRMTPALRAQITEYRRLNDQLKAFDKAMGNNQRNVGNYSSAFLGSIPVIGQFTTAVGLATIAYQGLQKSFTTNLKLDALDYSMKQVAGNTTKFTVTMDYLRKAANRFGLDFVSTVEAFKQWDAAAKYSNLTGEESRRVFDSVANAGAKLKLTNEQVQGTFLALSQMMSKGVVSMEELRRQLGDRIPGAFQLAAKSMGMTEAALNKMVSEGKLASDVFLPKFAAELDKAFGNHQNEKIESLQASVNRLSTEFDLLFKSDRATKFFSAITDGLTDLTSNINKTINSRSWKEFFVRISGMPGANAVGDAVKGVNEFNKLNDIQKATYGYANKEAAERVKILNTQKQLLDLRVKEYNLNPTAKNKENLYYVNSVYAEMIKINSELGLYETKSKTVLETTKKTAKAAQEFLSAVQSLAQKTDFSLELTESEGLDALLAKNKQKYIKYLDELDALEKKTRTGKNVTNRTETLALIDTTRKKIIENQSSEEKKIRIDFAKETADIISKIEEEAGISRESTRQRDIENSAAYYNKLRQQHQHNSDILLSIDEAEKEARRKIDEKWNNKAYENVRKIQNKINKIVDKPFTSTGNKDKVEEEMNKRLAQIDEYYQKIRNILKLNNLPTIGLNALQIANKVMVTSAAEESSSEMSRQMKNSIRRSVSSSLNGLSKDIVASFQSMYDIEDKYAKLRKDASSEQINALNKMMKLEKQINNGISSLFVSLANGLSSMGGGILTGAVSEGVSTGDFSQLKNLFKGDNKWMGYGATGSLLGGAISNLTPKTSVAGQALGGALAGAGSGAMVGAAISGPFAPIGAAIGALVGAIGGFLSASKANKQRELEEAQIAEQKRTNQLLERQNALAFTSSIIGQKTNQGIVTGVDRNAFGDITFEIEGRKLKAVMAREDAAQAKGL